jgi:drug/metabolite transporter (DMT)-like permease
MRVWAGLATIYVVWGSTYLGIRVMVETVPPLLGSGARFLAAGAIFAGWLVARGGRDALRATPRELGAAAIVGTLLLLGGNGLVAVAEQDVPSGLAALVVASVPLWIVVFRRVTGERIGPATTVSVLVGFAGVALLLAPGERPGHAPVGGVLIVVAADVRPGAFSLDSVLAFAYLVTFGSLAAFTAYTWLLANAPLSQVATYAYVNPVVAIALGAVVLGEDVTPIVAAGAGIIVASVAVTVRREAGQPPARAATASAPAPEPAG